MGRYEVDDAVVAGTGWPVTPAVVPLALGAIGLGLLRLGGRAARWHVQRDRCRLRVGGARAGLLGAARPLSV